MHATDVLEPLRTLGELQNIVKEFLAAEFVKLVLFDPERGELHYLRSGPHFSSQWELPGAPI